VHCLDATGLSSGLLYAFDAGGRFRLEAHSGLAQDAVAEAASGFGSMADLAALASRTESVACTGAAGDPPGLVRILRRLGQASLLAIPFPAGIEHHGLLVLLDATGQDLAEAHWSTFATALAAQFGQAVALGRGLARLAASEERYRRIVELTREGVVVSDVDGRIVFANARIADLLGTTPSAMAGGALADRAHPEDRAAAEALVVGGRTGPVEDDLRLVGKDARLLRVRATASPLHDDAGALVGVLAMLADVTERQRLEDELRQSQKLEAVGSLAGGIAHDFNNMLTVILGYAEILEAAPTLDAAHRAQIVQIRSASQQAARLTQQLLAFSRKQVLRLEVVDINAVVRDTETLLRRAVREDIELRLDLAPDAWRVRADAGQVVQVLLNLAVNARDAMPDGGTLSIRTSNRAIVAGAPDAPPCAAPGEYLALEAADTGTGMDEETRRRIFEPFFTTKAAGKGTGLGLATVYGIVRQCGGYVDVDSAPGKGARFRILLPRTRDAAPAATPASRPAAPPRPGTGRTVVVLEDDEQVRAFACVALRSAGYEAVPVAEAAEALSACAAASGPVVLLADLVMPGRSGPEVAADVCAANPRVRVVFMSGHAEPARMPRRADGSPAHVLAKPFSGRELLEAVRRAVDA
jgi:two-component system cell cycle sensor histidine kinase/response regulator CckA